jgi:hypothetical protein
MVFNAKKYREENPSLSSELPIGRYLVEAESAELKTSSSGYDMVTWKLRIKDSESGAFVNAIQWENLTIGHDSPKVQEIANEKLTEILLALDVIDDVDLKKLTPMVAGKTCVMTIKQAKASGRLYAVYTFGRKLDKQEPAQAQPTGYTELSIPHFEDDIPY